MLGHIVGLYCGVTLWYLLPLRSVTSSPPGYLQWRPVLYTSPDREILAPLTLNESKLYSVASAPVNLLQQVWCVGGVMVVVRGARRGVTPPYIK